MKNNFKDLLAIKPKSIAHLDEIPANIESKIVGNDHTKVRLIKPKGENLSLKKWIFDNSDTVKNLFEKDGVLVFKGFDKMADNSDFSEIVELVSEGKALSYSEPSTPRTKVKDQIYTSTEYPKEEIIPQHNEHSYSSFWPKKLFLYCDKPATTGGATPIADSRSVYKQIPKNILEKFETKGGVKYVRNFHNEMDIKWQDFFGTADKAQVEEYCRKKKMSFQWLGDEKLRVAHTTQAVIQDEGSDVKNWFNQAHLFHYSNLNPDVSDYLIDALGMENLPRNTFYGDGTEIALEDLKEIREAYERCNFRFEWEEGDFVIVNNIHFTHGRDSYSGDRSVLVAMSEEDSIENYSLKGNVFEASLETESGNKVSHVQKNTAEYFIKNQEFEQSEAMLKYKLALTCRLLSMHNLDEGSISGHVTVRVPNSDGLFWVNPFGILFEEVTPDNLLLVNENGDVLEGEFPLNVAGFCIHSTIHKFRPDINCIVHTHSPWGTLFSALEDCEVLPIDQNSAMFYNNHIVFDQFEGPVNTLHFAENLAEALGDNNVTILANHGTLTCGEDIESAFMFAFSLERAMRLNWEVQSMRSKIKQVSPEIAARTKEWISNPIGFKIEFDALARKAERVYPDLQQYRPK